MTDTEPFFVCVNKFSLKTTLNNEKLKSDNKTHTHIEMPERKIERAKKYT